MNSGDSMLGRHKSIGAVPIIFEPVLDRLFQKIKNLIALYLN